MLKEFKEFALKGNVLELAIAVIIGAAFNAIVKSLVEDIITPIIGLLFGKPDFSGIKLAGGINIGLFINSVVNFLIVSFVLFIVVKGMNMAREKMKKQEEVEETPAEEKIDAKEELLKEIRDLLKK
ncbi:large conductance mechanosensitive channel protein MscL [Gemelliphila palaticanis]|uniref:Large-conductance mechanosensitive channel n=1 Tax=Gemelliphila palaticanis TaxID=81950 RepID=A0ABX2T3K4_9BACL|nr:large conductance mechanosensitive channel protein MscL [Gemella palaticanis]MBF0716129.1 large conductance mechanosensitive channel protein MscL [Gemella palaticanis]NYS48059.1 large conductance mechanosensitive channel protein MscL [Gemella palaticanis]